MIKTRSLQQICKITPWNYNFTSFKRHKCVSRRTWSRAIVTLLEDLKKRVLLKRISVMPKALLWLWRLINIVSFILKNLLKSLVPFNYLNSIPAAAAPVSFPTEISWGFFLSAVFHFVSFVKVMCHLKEFHSVCKQGESGPFGQVFIARIEQSHWFGLFFKLCFFFFFCTGI